MKILFIAALGGCMLTLFTVNNAIAQKKGMTTLPDVTVTSTSNVSEKVAKVFNAMFKDAQNVQWTKLNKNFLAQFITADLKNRVLFHKNGEIVYHIKYGHENNLPQEIRRIVKSQYSYVDFNITSAINVLQDRRNIWVVNLEDNKKYVIVRFEDGELEEVSNLNKSLATN